MAKNMARIENGIVVNVEWLPDRAVETDTLKNMGDIPAAIGDTWEDGKFYRDGVQVLTFTEELQAANQDMETALKILLGGEAE